MSIPSEILNLMMSSSATSDTDTYQVSRSLRFNSVDLAYLSRTSVTSDRQKFTWSFWIKITSTAAEAVTGSIDFLSNGFKLRSTSFGNEATTFYFLAFSEIPFKYSRAR